MTSASELFYTRRSRLNRAAGAGAEAYPSDLGLGFDYSDRNPHVSQHHRRQSLSHHGHRHDLDGCDPLRRSPRARRSRHSHLERGTISLDQSSRQSASSNAMTMEPQRNIRRPGITASDRLPGPVLLARERLVERLRGVSLSGNRPSSRDPLRMTDSENLFDDHWRLADASDWGTVISAQASTPGSHLNDLNLPPERTDYTNKKKPPGLTQDTINSLCLEIFSHRHEGKEGTIEKTSGDCSICLDGFMEGDKLICLPCKHRFHSTCLDPWIRTCGDCPYCRKGIIFTDRTE